MEQWTFNCQSKRNDEKQLRNGTVCEMVFLTILSGSDKHRESIYRNIQGLWIERINDAEGGEQWEWEWEVRLQNTDI